MNETNIRGALKFSLAVGITLRHFQQEPWIRETDEGQEEEQTKMELRWLGRKREE